MSEAFQSSATVVKNDPRLFKLTPVRVVRPFCIKGVKQEPESIISIPLHVAIEMRAIGKVEII